MRQALNLTAIEATAGLAYGIMGNPLHINLFIQANWSFANCTKCMAYNRIPFASVSRDTQQGQSPKKKLSIKAANYKKNV